MEGSFPKLKLLASNTHDLHKDIVLYFKTNQQILKGHRYYHQITLTGWSVGIVIFPDFHSTKQGLPLVDSWSRGLDLNQMYPDRDTLSNVPSSGHITARDQSMVESGVTEGGKNTADFFLVNEHNTKTRPQAKKQRFFKLSQKRNSSLWMIKMQII